MKRAAILAFLLLLIAACGAFFLYLNSTVRIDSVTVSATEGRARAEELRAIDHALNLGAATGVVYDPDAVLSDPDDWVFYTYGITLSNGTRLDAEIIEAQITPMAGDVLQLWDGALYSLPAGATGTLYVTLLTRAEQHPMRELHVSWYSGGQPFSLRTIGGGGS